MRADFERGVSVAHDFQNGEHTDEWPAQDRPAATDGSDSDALTTPDSGTAEGAGNDSEAGAGNDSEAGAGTETGTEVSLDESTEAAAADGTEADAGTEPGAGNDADAGSMAEPDAEPAESAWGVVAEPASDQGLVEAEQRMDDEGMFAPDDSDAPVHLDDADADQDVDDEDEDDEDDDDDGESVELHNEGVRDIDATTVSITQGGARDVEATTVTINQGGAARIRADELTITQGGVALARTDSLTLREGGTAFAVVADRVSLDSESSVFLLVARSATGDVRPLLDWRAAAAFGAGFALILRLLRRGRR
jgi:hypothetical protein